MPKGTSERAGRYLKQPAGYSAFIPRPLPPKPALRMDASMQALLSRADRRLGRLDGITAILPNPDLFVAMYVRKEAVISSQIEGTQASLDDVLEFEAGLDADKVAPDAVEAVNYVRALNHGLDRVKELPLSTRLLREIHVDLLSGVRGGDKEPGELRRSQNWVGPLGTSLTEALYVPPPPDEMQRAMGELELFLHDSAPIPPLIKCALVHSQFETIHPFLDGNGRMGRLLITFILCQEGVLERPLLYLSHHFKRHRAEYYERLQAVRDAGDWEGWVRFFLQGVAEVAEEATETTRRILAMQERHREALRRETRSGNAQTLLDLLYDRPVISVRDVARSLGVTFNGANQLVARLQKLDLLVELTGGQRGRLFLYAPYAALLREGTERPLRPGAG